MRYHTVFICLVLTVLLALCASVEVDPIPVPLPANPNQNTQQIGVVPSQSTAQQNQNNEAALQSDEVDYNEDSQNDDWDNSDIAFFSFVPMPAFLPMVFTFPQGDGYYSSYDLEALTDQQKEVDSFIRSNTEIAPTANLTDAQGNNKDQFEYTYENNSQSTNITWVISAVTADSLQYGNQDNEQQTSQEQPKYVIIGRSRFQSRPFTEQQKKQFDQSMTELQQNMQGMQAQMQQQFGDWQTDFNNQMENFNNQMSNMNQQMGEMGQNLNLNELMKSLFW